MNEEKQLSPENLASESSNFENILKAHGINPILLEQSAEHGKPSGDFYLAEACPDGRVLVLFGDAAGHGQVAARFASVVCRAHRDILASNKALAMGNLSDLLTELDKKLVAKKETDANRKKARKNGAMYAVASYLRIDPGDGKIEISGGSGITYMILRKSGVMEGGQLPGFLVGTGLRPVFDVIQNVILPGDEIILATDGILVPFSFNHRGKTIVGSVEDFILKMIRSGETLKTAVSRILLETKRMASNKKNQDIIDDTTVLILNYRNPELGKPDNTSGLNNKLRISKRTSAIKKWFK